VYLTAAVEERAQRRYKQLSEKGISANLTDLLADLKARDARDIERVAAPLRAAADAVPLDSSRRSIDEVVRRLSGCIGSAEERVLQWWLALLGRLSGALHELRIARAHTIFEVLRESCSEVASCCIANGAVDFGSLIGSDWEV